MWRISGSDLAHRPHRWHNQLRAQLPRVLCFCRLGHRQNGAFFFVYFSSLSCQLQVVVAAVFNPATNTMFSAAKVTNTLSLFKKNLFFADPAVSVC